MGHRSIFLYFVNSNRRCNWIIHAPLESNKRQNLTPPSGTNPCKEFDLVAGDIAHANSVVLAENHNWKNKTVACANAIVEFKGLQNKEHLFLIEGVPAGEQVQCDKLRKFKGRICKGWDSEDKVLMHYRLLATINTVVTLRDAYEKFIDSYKPYYTSKPPIDYLDRQADTFLKKQISEQNKFVIKLGQNGKFKNLNLSPFKRVKKLAMYTKIYA